jgi:hypothetical protein
VSLPTQDGQVIEEEVSKAGRLKVFELAVLHKLLATIFCFKSNPMLFSYYPYSALSFFKAIPSAVPAFVWTLLIFPALDVFLL